MHNYKYSAGENQRIVQHLTQIATALADAVVFAAAADTESTPKVSVEMLSIQCAEAPRVRILKNSYIP